MSRKDNISEIQKSFGMQAAGFDSNTYHLSKVEYQDYMIEKVKPEVTDQVLEVAAGTCICGRAFALHVERVTCFDATEKMLAVGQVEAKKAGYSGFIGWLDEADTYRRIRTKGNCTIDAG